MRSRRDFASSWPRGSDRRGSCLHSPPGCVQPPGLGGSPAGSQVEAAALTQAEPTGLAHRWWQGGVAMCLPSSQRSADKMGVGGGRKRDVQVTPGVA